LLAAFQIEAQCEQLVLAHIGYHSFDTRSTARRNPNGRETVHAPPSTFISV
jgi:hypothetical protein